MANEKILVVDDDANICELLRLYLTKEGYQVTVANDGEEGLEKFNAVKPDMVLLVGARIMVDHAAYSALNQGILDFLVSTAVLSIGLGLFNLVPIPPLDGAKVLFSLLPDRMYDTMLRYERIGMFVLWGLVLLDVGSGALNSAIAWVFRIFCRIIGLS